MLRFSIGLILVAVATLSSAQSFEDQTYNFSVNVELVQLPVSVLDKHGLPVPGLKPEHFAVYEDKVLQNISLFKQEDVPLSVGLVVDRSSSMFDKLNSLHTAAMTFVHESNTEDETSIISFGNDVNLDQDFTANTKRLSYSLDRIVPNGNTSLYDAVSLAAKHLSANGFHDKKVLLVISDGEDNHSKYKLKEVLESIRESKIMIYSIGLLGPDSGDYSMMFDDTGKRALKQLAEVTGGAAYFPKGTREVEQVCTRIARDLRNQYTIGYRPTNEKLDGSWRKTIVRVTPPKSAPKVQVRTKQGYYAPKTPHTASPQL
jgi:Ca-activated chloride channel family protein